MDKLKIGLYGYGKVAELHARAIASVPGLELVSVCGRDSAKAAAFAARWSIQARASAAEMADLDGAQAAIITTPHPLHRSHSVECSLAGLHVLVEKPMALSVEDCDAMIAAAAGVGRLLGVILSLIHI